MVDDRVAFSIAISISVSLPVAVFAGRAEDVAKRGNKPVVLLDRLLTVGHHFYALLSVVRTKEIVLALVTAVDERAFKAAWERFVADFAGLRIPRPNHSPSALRTVELVSHLVVFVL
jgi:hypothetical protein